MKKLRPKKKKHVELPPISNDQLEDIPSLDTPYSAVELADRLSYDPKRQQSRGQRRRHLDERLRALQRRAIIIEKELQKLEGRFYRTCIFGSARIKPDTSAYKQAYELARLLACEGIDILTGGGPGLMEAANKGAKLGRKQANSKSLSYGLSIELPFEPLPNPHLDIKRHHLKFSSRLDDFMRLSNSIVVTPGGIGTVLELAFAWQLIQVKHMTKRPIILLDRDFWAGFLRWMEEFPLKRKLINEDDIHNITVVNTPEEAAHHVALHHKEFIAQHKRHKATKNRE